MTKAMMDLPMDTKNRDCTCGGPPKNIDTPCPECGEKGVRVKSGTVRYHLHEDALSNATDKIYGLCLSPECNIAWYSQDGSHSFTTAQTDTQIWTKKDADPVMACYCNNITREQVAWAICRKGMRTVEEITNYYCDEPVMACAAKNPAGKCCHEHFEKMISEELLESMRCKCG